MGPFTSRCRHCGVVLTGGFLVVLTTATAEAREPAAMARRALFYNNSYHDGYKPGIDAGVIEGDKNDDSDAIDPTKSPLLPGAGQAMLANYTGSSKGVNGLIYDIAKATRTPDIGDFQFSRIGRAGTDVPVPVAPSGLVVQALDAELTRVVVTFADSTVINTWLQVDIGPGFGLLATDVHWWGSAAGDTGSTSGENILVDQTDELAIRDHPWFPSMGPIPVTWRWNVTEDDACDQLDGMYVRSHPTNPTNCVKLISAPMPATELIARRVFYNQSYYDGYKLGIDPEPLPTTTAPPHIPHEDDSDAIDPSKYPLRPGDGMAVFANWTGYEKGINGLIYDIAYPTRTPEPGDFLFETIGKQGTSAPTPQIPTAFAVRPLGWGVQRVTLTFASGSIKNGWLRVTIGTGFGLTADDVHYWGHATCDSGVGNYTQYILVSATDELAARNNRLPVPNRVSVDHRYDYNKDGNVTATDEVLCRNNRTFPPDLVRMIVH